MFRNNNSNTAVPLFLNQRFQYPADVSNQPQLYANLPIEYRVDPVNSLENTHGTAFLPSNKSFREIEAMPIHNLQFSLNNKISQDEPDRKVGILSQNPVCTGLRLSYDDDERKSSVTSASGSMMGSSSLLSSLNDEIIRELDQQNKELDHFIRTQEESMIKGMRDIKQRQMVSLLTSLEKGIAKKLQEKDLELETVTRKNKELVMSMKQATEEAQNWCYMAKYNESVANVLKTNLQQAMEGSGRFKEGFGDNELNDTASCIDPNNFHDGSASSSLPSKSGMTCRSCKTRNASVLLMPCRHLCLCKECEGFVSACPVCQMITTVSLEVYLS